MNDSTFLREIERPDYESVSGPVSIVDLFSGCGGLTLGLAEAARRLGRAADVRLAVDFDAAICNVFAHNFPKANAVASAVEGVFDGGLGDPPTPTEEPFATGAARNPIDWLHGGPPCQGHSDLNNHTRRDDPRNAFYLRMVRAAEILKPRVVLIENVPGVQHDKSGVVQLAKSHLIELGYMVATRVSSLAELGVPQRRRRHTLLGLRGVSLDPAACLEQIHSGPTRDLRWAIGDLEGASDSPLDTPSRMTSVNKERAQWLLEKGEHDLPNELRPECHQGEHSYVSMYGRLHWDRPAQTITSGFGSMGQGRYLHPSRPRTLTPHEAARIQFFPDWFDFTAGGLETRRGVWATMIGNAVPPKLTMELGRLLIPYLTR